MIFILKAKHTNTISKNLRINKRRYKRHPYIEETLKILTVGGYRSAIGSFWNAVVDDLRNKILFRSISMFNKEMKPR